MKVQELIEKLQALNMPEREIMVLYDGAVACCGLYAVYSYEAKDKYPEDAEWLGVEDADKVILRTDQ